MNGAPRQRFELRASHPFAGLLVAAHAGAGLAGALSLGGGVAGWAVAAGFAALGMAAARRHAWLAAGASPLSLETGPQGWCRVVTREGRAWEGCTRARRVTSWWVLVPPAAAGASSVLVARGMLEPQAFRRLRVWGLWGGMPPGPEPASA